MTRTFLGIVPALFFAMALAGCGGAGGAGVVAVAGGGSGGGIGGTGLTSSGTIDGFGSVFVNGVEFETDGAEILLDGRNVSEEELALGMVVLVTGSVNQDGVTGTASRIVFDDEVQGPVVAIVRDADGDSMLVTVLDNKVIVERTGTVFKGVNFSGLALGDLIEVSGFTDLQGRLRATRVEKKDTFRAGISEIELKGIVTGLAGSEFLLRGYTVDYSGADLSEVPGGVLAEGIEVEVEGTLDPVSQRIVASRVEQESALESRFDEEDVDVQGVITGFAGAAQMRVNGVAVDARVASLSPSNLVLADGVIVEAEGVWENGILRARRIEARRGRVEIEARVASVDSAGRTITLQLPGGSISVQVDSRTMLDDDTDRSDRLTLADIRPGDFLDIEAIRLDQRLVATRIDRDDPDDDVLQGVLEAFTAGDRITLLGITYSTAGAEFRSLDERSLTPEEFYAALQLGALVKVRDEVPADGIAEKVEFEFEGALDGERDFDDDEFDGDDNDDGKVNKPDNEDEADEPENDDNEADEPDEHDDEVDEPEDEEDEVDDPESEEDEEDEPENEKP